MDKDMEKIVNLNDSNALAEGDLKLVNGGNLDLPIDHRMVVKTSVKAESGSNNKYDLENMFGEDTKR